MPDFSHVSPGDRQAIKADVWNEVLDSAKAHRDRDRGRTGGGPLGAATLPSLEVLLVNNTGANIPFGGPVRLGDEAYTIDFAFGKRPAYAGLKPTGSSGDVIAIAAEPIVGYAIGNEANGTGNGVGRVVLAGHAVANISISNASHRFAVANANNSQRMHSAANGSIPILGEINTTGNMTLGVLLGGLGNAATAATTVAFGNVTAYGGANDPGLAGVLTLLANGSIATTGSNLNFSNKTAGYQFPTGTNLLFAQIGNSFLPIPTQLANGVVPGFVANVAQQWDGAKTFTSRVKLHNGFETGNGATSGPAWEGSGSLIRVLSGYAALDILAGNGTSNGHVYLKGFWGNNTTIEGQYGNALRAWLALTYDVFPNGAGVHFGYTGVSGGSGYLELRGNQNVVAINGVTGKTGTLGVGASVVNGWVLDLGNGPVGSVTSVNAATSISGLSFTGGPVTTGGTFTLTLTSASSFRAAIDAPSTEDVSDLGMQVSDLVDAIADLQAQLDDHESRISALE